MPFPRLYAIADIDLLQARALDLASFTSELRAAGVKLLQYRNKNGSPQTILHDTALLRGIFPAGGDVRLIMNDRADLALLSGYDGVHVGQEDLAPEDARSIVGPDRWVGVSTHSPRQVIEADETSCDYIAYGPIFATASKANPDPTVGLAGLRMARTETKKPLVAIGGITLENLHSVLDAGTDCVAIISGLLPDKNNSKSQSTQQIVEEFSALLG